MMVPAAAVDRDELDPALDQAPRQEAALSEGRPAVAVAKARLLLFHVEGRLGLRGEDHLRRALVELVVGADLVVALHRAAERVDRREQLLPPRGLLRVERLQ